VAHEGVIAMNKCGLAAAALAVLLGTASPALAGSGAQGAEKIRRLDIMLMVTALRCRAGRDDFTADYARFTRQHMAMLNAANAELRGAMTARFGARAAERALDRSSTSMANDYGQGHPWLSCAELGQAARGLAQVQGRATLEEAADQLLDTSRSSRWALRAR